MHIRGAVLERSTAARPFGSSRPIMIDDLELEGPAADEVLIRIDAAGVCHSDLSVVNGDRPRPLPMLLGHEAAGRVEALGEGVEDLAVGDMVVASFLPRCGQCRECGTAGRVPCRNGTAANGAGELLGGGRRLRRGNDHVAHHLGVSGFATHAVLHRSSLVAVDEDVPAEVAALMGCAVLTGGGAIVNVVRPERGQRIVVVGLGGVGMAGLLTALAHDDVEVVGVDAASHKLDTALALGAHAVYSPQEALDAGISGDGVLEAAGSARAFETAVALTAVGGSTVTVGLPHPDARASVSPLDLVAGARRIIGSYLGSAVPSRDIPRFLEWWRAGRLPVEHLVSSRIALEDINEGMDALADGRATRQIVTTR